MRMLKEATLWSVERGKHILVCCVGDEGCGLFAAAT